MTSLRKACLRGSSRMSSGICGVIGLGLFLGLVGPAPVAQGAGAAAPSASAAPAAAAPAASPAAEAPAGPVSAPSGAAVPAGEGAYTVRLRALEKNVNELKEQVFRTKARLNLLKETVLGGVIGAARAVIHHRNEVGSNYRLVRVVYALDGVQIFAKTDETGRAFEAQEFDVYNGAIQPGSHTLSVVMEYRGNSRAGIFTYTEGYKFTARGSHSFAAGEQKSINLTVVGKETGNLTTQYEDRLATEFRESVVGSDNASAAK